ncbi:MAG TPA: hypothetical protein PK830_10560 [Candidatus Atribacteria bacterium]|nr:hypothetical protein [Candidatus Atribacteria bacterium]
MKMLDLSGEWRLRAEFLDVTAMQYAEVASREDGRFEMHGHGKPRPMPSRSGYLTANVPCDVIVPLVENGILKEPLLKTNSDDCMWVGDYSWWFIKSFTVTEELYGHEEVRLFIETLDYNADIIVSGRYIGNHKNTFRPFYADVKHALKVGENQIIIRLTTGYEEYHPNDSLTFYCNSDLGQRVYLRKPQFTHGWDWCKPVPTCGIGGRVELEGVSGAKISSFRCDTLSIGNNTARLRLHFEVENLSMCTADDACLSVDISFDGKTVFSYEKDFYASGGVNFIDDEIEIRDPKLWWPNGSGGQPLYTVSAGVTCRGHENRMPDRKIGIRTITVDQTKLADGSRYFNVIVNGKRIFCKGGNWVPADSVYLRIPKEKYEKLVREAANCNFNMLRVWGGGLYEPDCFYDYCSEYGIMVMQDFMYACAFYPDYLPWFMHEAALEAEYQTKRLGYQACLAIWSGNNEVHESYTDWFQGEVAAEHYHGTKIFNYLLPEIVRKNTPCVHYMPSSPFYGNKANDMLSGDCHLWNWTRQPHETGFAFAYELEAFDRLAARVRFSSEYGFYGALKYSSVEKYFDGEKVEYNSPIWNHHGEDESKKQLNLSTIDRHLTDSSKLGAEEYLLYSGILQGILYDELTCALRRREHCSGKLIWMYNDCWPETGWTVIDYYTTRKNSYYFLKRAFEHRKLIIRAIDGVVSVSCINDRPEDVCAELEYGHMDFDGNVSARTIKTVEVKAFGRFDFDCFDAAHDLSKGFYYVKDLKGNFDTAISLRGYYRDVEFPDANIETVCKETIDGRTRLVIRTDKFVPVVNVITSSDTIHLSDNYFMLLPDEEKEVWIDAADEDAGVEAVRFEKR